MSYDQIQVNTQSSIRIEGSKTVYFDPFLIESGANDADVILITHSHQDHFDPESIGKVSNANTVFVVPAGMEKKMGQIAAKEQLRLLSPGDEIEVEGLKIKALPAYNKAKPFHPKRNKWLGYLLEMDETRYYVAGDTDVVKELQAVQCDIALVPIGGTYTMTAKDASGLINQIKPVATVPTHYGTIVGKKEDADEFRSLVDPDIEVVFKL